MDNEFALMYEEENVLYRAWRSPIKGFCATYFLERVGDEANSPEKIVVKWPNVQLYRDYWDIVKVAMEVRKRFDGTDIDGSLAQFLLCDVSNGYIVSDYSEGLSLAEIMKGDAKRNREVCEIVDFCRTLVVRALWIVTEMNAQGVIHRDFKPDNLICKNLFGDDLVLIDLDFMALSHSKRSWNCDGTSKYQSLGVIEGQNFAAGRDMYALAMTCLEMLESFLRLRCCRMTMRSFLHISWQI